MNKILSLLLTLIAVGAVLVAGFFLFARFAPSDLLSKDIVQPAASQFYDNKGELISTTDSEEDRIPISIIRCQPIYRMHLSPWRMFVFMITLVLI